MKGILSAFVLLSLMVPVKIQAQGSAQVKPFEVILCLAAVGAVVPTETSFSQERPPVMPGDRVRVTAPDCELRKQTGVLASLDRDLFTAALGGVDTQCPTGALTRLEVSFGERRWWKSSLVGLGIGAGAGVVTGVAVCAGEESDLCGVLAFFFTAITSTAGLLVGTAVGLIRGKDRWEEVPFPLVQPYVGPSMESRINLGFSIPLRR